jgi:hypothetical protein
LSAGLAQLSAECLDVNVNGAFEHDAPRHDQGDQFSACEGAAWRTAKDGQQAGLSAREFGGRVVAGLWLS